MDHSMPPSQERPRSGPWPPMNDLIHVSDDIQPDLTGWIGGVKFLQLIADVILALCAGQKIPLSGACPDLTIKTSRKQTAGFSTTTVAIGDIFASIVHPIVFITQLSDLRSHQASLAIIFFPRRPINGTALTRQSAISYDFLHVHFLIALDIILTASGYVLRVDLTSQEFIPTAELWGAPAHLDAVSTSPYLVERRSRHFRIASACFG